MIGSSSARIRERLADGDVIEVEVKRGSLLDQGFLGVVFISLRDVVGSYSARVPGSSLAEVHKEFVHHIVEDEVDGQKQGQGDKKVESSKRSDGRTR